MDVCLKGKSDENGWWTGVPPWLRKPPYGNNRYFGVLWASRLGIRVARGVPSLVSGALWMGHGRTMWRNLLKWGCPKIWHGLWWNILCIKVDDFFRYPHFSNPPCHKYGHFRFRMFNPRRKLNSKYLGLTLHKSVSQIFPKADVPFPGGTSACLIMFSKSFRPVWQITIMSSCFTWKLTFCLWTASGDLIPSATENVHWCLIYPFTSHGDVPVRFFLSLPEVDVQLPRVIIFTVAVPFIVDFHVTLQQ